MNLGPYHLARMEALAKLHPNLLVVEIGTKQGIYPWRAEKKHLSFNIETLFNKNVENISAYNQRSAIIGCLEKYRPKAVVVSGYSQLVMRTAAKWARKKGIFNILLFVSTELDHPRVWWREWIKRHFIVRKFSCFAVAGSRSSEYAHKLGVSKKRIFNIRNVVDNQRIKEHAEKVRKNGVEKRKEFGLPKKYFLYVGRLSYEKNLTTLIDAFWDYRKSGGTWDLVLVGTGKEETTLKKLTNSDRQESLHFVGWKQFDDLIAHYTLAKALILPSVSEPWGLVVNEGMCCGLPVLVSRNCGCVPELCQDGINALVFDPSNKEDLMLCMLQLSGGELNLDAMGRKSSEIIDTFTPEIWAQRLLRIFELTSEIKI
jgi:glycosyltransferase involved in cell wall biosynthesis